MTRVGQKEVEDGQSQGYKQVLRLSQDCGEMQYKQDDEGETEVEKKHSNKIQRKPRRARWMLQNHHIAEVWLNLGQIH